MDRERFVPGQAPTTGLVWIAEQIPGFVECADVTDIVVAQGGVDVRLGDQGEVGAGAQEHGCAVYMLVGVR